jgi:hypothetical protein
LTGKKDDLARAEKLQAQLRESIERARALSDETEQLIKAYREKEGRLN